MVLMSVKKDNTTVPIVMPKSLKKEAEKAADKSERTLSAWVRVAIIEKLQRNK